jgi:RNA polymerase sigma-70 factor (ECF subfamily)
MFNKAVSYDLLWDAAALEGVDESRRWILAAMRQHGHELVTLLWRILGNEQDVCDAYQTTFLRLAHHEGGLKPRWIKAYLFRTASNTAISMLRQRLIERRALNRVADALPAVQGRDCLDGGAVPTAAAANDAQIDVDVRNLTENLRCQVARLPEHFRTVIMLRDFGELSYSEVARIMDITVGTARVYRCKAVQLLAAWMNKEDPL